MNSNPTSLIEKTALVSSSSRGGHGSHGRGKSTHLSDDRDRLNCEHCGCFKHTKDQCWDLHGLPPDLTSRPSSRGGGRLSEGYSAHSVASTSSKLSIMPPITLPPALMILTPSSMMRLRLSDTLSTLR